MTINNCTLLDRWRHILMYKNIGFIHKKCMSDLSATDLDFNKTAGR